MSLAVFHIPSNQMVGKSLRIQKENGETQEQYEARAMDYKNNYFPGNQFEIREAGKGATRGTGEGRTYYQINVKFDPESGGTVIEHKYKTFAKAEAVAKKLYEKLPQVTWSIVETK
jgi:hypothetical protein